MDNKSDDQFLIMQDTIYDNRQATDYKMKTYDSNIDKLTVLIKNIDEMMGQNQNSIPSIYYMYFPKAQDPTTVVLVNNKAPPLEGGNSTKIGVMCNLKDEIISPKLYELLVKIEPKCDTAMDLNNFYNHIKICLKAMTRIQEYLLTGYQSMKRHSEFQEYFTPDSSDPSYY